MRQSLHALTVLLPKTMFEPRPFKYDPDEMVDIVFRHYTSQVEPVYSKGIIDRAAVLQEQYQTDYPLECIYAPK